METSSKIANSTLTLADKESLLKDVLKDCQSLIVAYSGGVDSSVLAHYARLTLGESAKIVIAVSPSLAAQELDAARNQALERDWNLVEINTDEVSRSDYQRNDALRCYFCKSTLFEALDRMSASFEIKHVAYGANVDDLMDFRPGHKAAREHNVLSPLQTAHLSKVEIRELARLAGLPSWNRPQAACLSSRFPTFEPVTISALSRVDKAETYLRSLGFRQVRVRNHTLGNSPAAAAAGSYLNDSDNAASSVSYALDQLMARIEVDANELMRFASEPTLFQLIREEFKRLDYDLVVLDLDGYKQGSGNITNLRKPQSE